MIFWIAGVAAFQKDAGHLLKTVGIGIDEVAQDVERARGGELCGDFNAGDEADAQACGFSGGFLEAVAGVVVGQRDASEARVGGGLHELRWRKRAIGGSGVRMEINKRHQSNLPWWRR